MKTIITLFVSLFFGLAWMAKATEQESDWIIYKDAKCALDTHWMFPSPLEFYFKAHPELEYPFESTSTGNYRGHVATWQIEEGRLYVVGIERSNNISGDVKLGPNIDLAANASGLVKKIFGEREDSKGQVFADWFTGNLRVFSKPVKSTYKHPDDSEGFEVTQYS